MRGREIEIIILRKGKRDTYRIYEILIEREMDIQVETRKFGVEI